MQAARQPTRATARRHASSKLPAGSEMAHSSRWLTALISKLLTQHIAAGPTLAEWHDRAIIGFHRIVKERRLLDHVQLGMLVRSYRVHGPACESLPPHTLIRELASAFHRLNNILPNHSVFYPHTRRDLAPYFTQVAKAFPAQIDEVLECVASIAVPARIEFWRVSSQAFATHISLHSEDEEYGPASEQIRLSPVYLTRNLADIVLHATVLSDRVKGADAAEFRCEWSGLAGRELVDKSDPLAASAGKVARVDAGLTRGEWPCDELRRNWPKIVSALGGPIIRLFDPEAPYSSDLVRNLIARL